MLAQSAADGNDSAHGNLGGGKVAAIIHKGMGQGLFGDEVAAIGGNSRQLCRVPAAMIENDELIEHIAPAGVGALNFESLRTGLEAQLFPHGSARSEVEEFVDDTVFLIEKRTRLGPGGQRREQAVRQKPILVSEAKGLQID